MTKATGTSNSMKIRLRILRKVEVDDHIHSLDIDTTSEKIGTDEITADAVAEVVEDAIAVGLEHFSMRVET